MTGRESLVVEPVRMVHHPACPDPSKARKICECGANVACSACAWGRGAHPCKCRPAKPLGNVIA